MYCKYCGNKIEKDELFCAKCGKKIIKDENDLNTNIKMKNKQNKVKIIIIILLVIIAIAISLFFVTTNIIKKEKTTGELNNTSEESKTEQKFNKYLKDKEWVKENLYIKIDSFGNEVDKSVRQEVEYMEIEDNDSSGPICITITKYEPEGAGEGIKCTILTYEEENKLKVENIDGEEAKSATKYLVNKNKRLIWSEIHHTGANIYKVYSLDEPDKEIAKFQTQERYNNGRAVITNREYNGNKVWEDEYNKAFDEFIDYSVEKENTFQKLSI